MDEDNTSGEDGVSIDVERVVAPTASPFTQTIVTTVRLGDGALLITAEDHAAHATAHAALTEDRNNG